MNIEDDLMFPEMEKSQTNRLKEKIFETILRLTLFMESSLTSVCCFQF